MRCTTSESPSFASDSLIKPRRLSPGPGAAARRDRLAGLAGRGQWLRGETKDAAATFETVLQQNAAEPEVLNGLGLIWLQQGRESDAAKLFAAALKANPAVARTYSNLGVALGRLGNWPEAVANHAVAVRLETQRHGFMTQPTKADLCRITGALGSP